MGYYSFYDDLKIAKRTENEVIELLKKKHGDNFELLKISDSPYYDIKCNINNKVYFIEVKEDFYCKKSGNIALEFKCRGKPSGIDKTKATIYIYKVHDVDKIIYLFFSVSKLKQMIENKKYFKIVIGGDKNSKTHMYLFKKDIFFKYANKKYIK